MGEMIGLVVVNRRFIGNDDINWLRSNFEIESLVNFDRHRAKAQSYVTQFLINPAFSRFARFVLREVMRVMVKTLLFFQPAQHGATPKEIIAEMCPVLPRRRMEPSPGESLPLRERPSSGPDVDKPLFHLTKHMLVRPKKNVFKRVVVVGGSGSAYALLEKLCFDYANYPNIFQSQTCRLRASSLVRLLRRKSNQYMEMTRHSVQGIRTPWVVVYPLGTR